ncbi:MAG: transcriptional regulator GcvA [Pseudomonadota bacterium]
MRHLPPLTSIKAFEAAARHKNFKLAAAELHVTPAAVSLQVRQLEDWLGAQLFDRSGKNLALSAKGQAYLPELTAALNLLANATEQLTGNGIAGPLRITALPSFAGKWLLPRLAGFREQHPDIELVLETSTDSRDFAGQQFDLAIRSGAGRWRGMQADLIAQESLTPMCSPALLQGPLPLAQPADLHLHPLLHDAPRDGWPRWLAMHGVAGVAGIDASRGYVFNDSSLVLQAAMEGLGVALGRTFLAADDLTAGRLVAPFPHTLPNDYGYWLVYPKTSPILARIMVFREWILAQAGGKAK